MPTEPIFNRWWVGRTLLAVLVVLLVLLPSALLWTSYQVLNERRTLLLGQLENEVTTSVENLAALVGERARDVHSDLTLATSFIAQTRSGSAAALPVLRSHLIALNRVTRHYLSLWYMEQGEVIIQVTGSRSDDSPAPPIAARFLTEMDHRALAARGQIVVDRLAATDGPPHERLRLLGLAPETGEGTIVILVAMDALFETLQGRATLPGAELWVVDAEGSVLVDPGGTFGRQEILTAMSSATGEDRLLIGEAPWPWISGGSQVPGMLLVSRSRVTPPFRWTTGLAAHLDGIAADLQALAMRLLLLFVLLFMALSAVAAVLSWYLRRQGRLRERLESQAVTARMRDQLIQAEKLSNLGQIAAGLAHEIGTPLGVISIRLDQLHARTADTRDRDRISIMKEQIERISAIIRQLLDYARPQTTELRPVPVHETVTSVLSLLDHRLSRGRIAASNEVPSGVKVLVDLNQLHQVLLNLLVNACDACTAGGQVAVRLVDDRGRKGQVGIAVVDNGPGMSPEIQHSVFEPFFTTKPRGQGTGLGLTVVKDIVEHHGGSIEVTNTPEGSCFTVWLASAEGEGIAGGATDARTTREKP